MIYGHSQLSQFVKYPPKFSTVSVKFFSVPGAKALDLIDSHFSPDLIFLFAGGNDLTFDCSVAVVYDSLKTLVTWTQNRFSPKYGVHLLEIEERIGDPRFVNPNQYKTIRNAINKKIKAKRELNLLPLTKFGVVAELTSDRVHYKSAGLNLLLKAIKHHICAILVSKGLRNIEVTNL